MIRNFIEWQKTRSKITRANTHTKLILNIFNSSSDKS